MDAVEQILTRRFVFGDLSFTPGSILLGVALLLALTFCARVARRILRDRILPRAGIARGVSIALATLAYYIVMIIGTLVLLPVMVSGFNLHTLSLMVGAISFGIGFGLRNIADNFVSGLILLIERPIKVGDRIQVGDVFGDVTEIKARATIVRTNDNMDIIVPNSEFISSRVTNMTYRDNRVRMRIPVGVHYRSDIHVVRDTLIEAALEVESALQEPPPEAMFVEFADSSLNFELWVWTETRLNRPTRFRSEVNFKVWEKLRARGIEVPYPQRDLHIKELPEHFTRLIASDGATKNNLVPRN